MSSRRLKARDGAGLLLDRRVRILFRNLPFAMTGDEEAIHDLRVSGRRLRVVLPLLSRKPEGRRVRGGVRSLKKLVSTAGASRDADVCLGLLKRHPQADAQHRAERLLLRRRLRAVRNRSRARMVEELLDLPIRRLRSDLRSILSRGGEEPPVVANRVRAAMHVWGGEALSALQDLAGRFDPEELHAMRTLVRKLRYACEVGTSFREDLALLTERLRILQEDLGSLHDCHVLAQWLARQEEAASGARPALAEETQRLQEVFSDLSERHHQEFLSRDPAGVFRRCTETTLLHQASA